jgi:hypothetical protein
MQGMAATINFRVFYLPIIIPKFKILIKAYKTTILVLLLYGLSLKDNKLRVIHNMLQGRILGFKREKVTEGCRKLHSDDVFDSHPVLELTDWRACLLWHVLFFHDSLASSVSLLVTAYKELSR